MTGRGRDQVVGLGMLGLVFAAAGAASLGFPTRARIFPLFVGVLGTLLVAGEWMASRRRVARAQAPGESRDTFGVGLRRILPYLAWLLGFFALAALIGFVSAGGVFVAVFLRREAEVEWGPALVALVAICGFLVVIGNLFGLHWPVSFMDPLLMLGIL